MAACCGELRVVSGASASAAVSGGKMGSSELSGGGAVLQQVK